MQNKLIIEIKDEIGLDYWIILLPPHKKQIQYATQNKSNTFRLAVHMSMKVVTFFHHLILI